MHWVRGSGRCELQVRLSSTALLALATLVSHEMQRHQTVNMQPKKKKRRGVLLGKELPPESRSSAGKQIPTLTSGNFQLQVKEA